MGGLQAAFSRLSWGDEEVVKVRITGLCLIMTQQCKLRNIMYVNIMIVVSATQLYLFKILFQPYAFLLKLFLCTLRV